MASYDESGYYAENGAYVLEAGDYEISLRTNAHQVMDDFRFKYHLDKTIVYAAEEGSSGVDGILCQGEAVI